MSILGKIKKGVENSGSSMGKLVYTKDGSKLRVRFLQDVEDGVEIRIHDHYENGINALCQEVIGKSCPYCDIDEEGWRHRDGYVWSVFDHDAKEVKLFVGYANNFSHLPQLIGMAEAYGNWTDRDYVLGQTGKQLNKQLSVIPMDKVKFKNAKAKPYTKKALLDILNKAYPVKESDAVGNKNGKKKSKKQEEQDFDDEDEEEMDYEEMSVKELYAECVERDIEAKKKQKAQYYIDLLEAYDEENDEEDEEESEYESMSEKELYMECIERGLKAKKKQKAEYYIEMLEEDDEANDDEDEDEDDDDGEW